MLHVKCQVYLLQSFHKLKPPKKKQANLLIINKSPKCFTSLKARCCSSSTEINGCLAFKEWRRINLHAICVKVFFCALLPDTIWHISSAPSSAHFTQEVHMAYREHIFFQCAFHFQPRFLSQLP